MAQLTRRQVLVAAAAAAAAGGATVALAGCGGSTSKGNEALNKNKDGAMSKYSAGQQFKATSALSFPILYNNHPFYPLKDDWLFWSELTKRTNVKFAPVAVPLSDYNQKRGVMIGAGNAPPIIPKTYHPQETAFVASGAVIPVSDYIDLMPNYADKVKKWNLKANLDTFRQADGKYYLLPGLHEQPWQDYTLAVRTDVLAQLGLSTPKTWDDVYTMLKAMKAAYPKSYPLSDRFNKSPVSQPGGNLLSIVAQGFGALAGWQYQHAQWDTNAKKFVFSGATDGYRQMIEYLNKLFKEGLLDPENFTQTDDKARQKLANGQSFVISSNAQNLVNDYRPDLAKTNPKATMAKIPVPIGPVGPVIDSATRLENGLMVSKQARQSKNFVAMMQMIDWLWYSDAGQEFAKWGVEGTTYTKDASGNYKLSPDITFVGLNTGAPKHLQKDFGFSNGVFAYGGSTKLLESTFTDEEKAFQKEMNTRKLILPAPPYPLTDMEREQATLWDAPLSDYVFQNTLKFILGQRPLSEWDAYVGELKAKNMTQYMDMVNKAHERYQKDHG